MSDPMNQGYADFTIGDAESLLAGINAEYDYDDMSQMLRAWEMWPAGTRALVALQSDASPEWWSTLARACVYAKRRDVWDAWEAAMPRAQEMVDAEIARLVAARPHCDQFETRKLNRALRELRQGRKDQMAAIERRANRASATEAPADL